MTVVLDVSAGLEIILKRPRSTGLREYLANCNKVITFDLYKAETANVLWKFYLTLARRNGAALLTPDKTLTGIAIQEGIEMPSIIHPSKD